MRGGRWWRRRQRGVEQRARHNGDLDRSSTNSRRRPSAYRLPGWCGRIPFPRNGYDGAGAACSSAGHFSTGDTPWPFGTRGVGSLRFCTTTQSQGRHQHEESDNCRIGTICGVYCVGAGPRGCELSMVRPWRKPGHGVCLYEQGTMRRKREGAGVWQPVHRKSLLQTGSRSDRSAQVAPPPRELGWPALAASRRRVKADDRHVTDARTQFSQYEPRRV
jgi:hypothetical protein